MREAVTEMVGITQGQPRRHEAAQTHSGDEMFAGVKAGDFVLQPGDHFFRDETAKIFTAGVVLLAGLQADMV